MKPHKWAKEIHAWADGAEIELRYKGTDGKWSQWIKAHTENSAPDWDSEIEEYRIKQQPKESQYLYVYNKGSLNKFDFYCSLNELTGMDARTHQFIGKIKLEVDDE